MSVLAMRSWMVRICRNLTAAADKPLSKPTILPKQDKVNRYGADRAVI